MMILGIISDERAYRSKSPAMHTSVMKGQGIEGVYLPFMVAPELVGEAVRGLRALNIAGVNVTVPYKEAVMPHLDEISAEAKAIGAVNTIALQNKRLVGYNTDARGFTAALAASGFEASGRTALVLGTGGAAKAVLFALSQMDLDRIILAGRNQARTAELAQLADAQPISIDALASGPIEAALIINATSVSSEAESPELAGLVQRLTLSGCQFVFDLNYGREQNIWQDLAQKNKAFFTDGLAMLAHQARLSFALWTGVEVEVDQFLDSLLKETL